MNERLMGLERLIWVINQRIFMYDPLITAEFIQKETLIKGAKPATSHQQTNLGWPKLMFFSSRRPMNFVGLFENYLFKFWSSINVTIYWTLVYFSYFCCFASHCSASHHAKEHPSRPLFAYCFILIQIFLSIYDCDRAMFWFNHRRNIFVRLKYASNHTTEESELLKSNFVIPVRPSSHQNAFYKTLNPL